MYVHAGGEQPHRGVANAQHRGGQPAAIDRGRASQFALALCVAVTQAPTPNDGVAIPCTQPG